MQLNLIEMQALEYVFKKSGIKSKAWYRSKDELFQPNFFDDGANKGFVRQQKVADIWTTLQKIPILFSATLEDVKDHRVMDSHNVLSVMQQEKKEYGNAYNKVQLLTGLYDVFHESTLATVTYRDGLKLDAVSLDQQVYELVGFEQS